MPLKQLYLRFKHLKYIFGNIFKAIFRMQKNADTSCPADKKKRGTQIPHGKHWEYKSTYWHKDNNMKLQCHIGNGKLQWHARMANVSYENFLPYIKILKDML